MSRYDMRTGGFILFYQNRLGLRRSEKREGGRTSNKACDTGSRET